MNVCYPVLVVLLPFGIYKYLTFTGFGVVLLCCLNFRYISIVVHLSGALYLWAFRNKKHWISPAIITICDVVSMTWQCKQAVPICSVYTKLLVYCQVSELETTAGAAAAIFYSDTLLISTAGLARTEVPFMLRADKLFHVYGVR